MLDQITPIVLTFNEEPNIARTLTALSWANEIIILDSGSTDETLVICRKFNNTRIIHRDFDNFANQCNFALQQDISTEWVLSIDADYVLTTELIFELQKLKPQPETNGYQIAFEYLISGQILRGSLYPPRTSLYKKEQARYQQDGHAHRVEVKGSISKLRNKLQHDDRKPFKRWLKSQWGYAEQEARKLKKTDWVNLSIPDKLRKAALAPLIIIPYTLLFKGLIFNALPGLIYSAQRLIAEIYLQVARLKLIFNNE